MTTSSGDGRSTLGADPSWFSAICTYFLVAFFELTFMSNNPAFLATCGMGAGWITYAVVQRLTRNERPHAMQASIEARS